MRRFRWLAALAPLLLVAAAGPPAAQPDSSPGEQSLSQDRVVNVYDWLRILPAPDTPGSYRQAPAPVVQWPLHGTLTQPFGCTNFDLEHPTDTCPGGFHTGIDIAQSQGVPIQAAGPGLAYSFTDTERYGNHVLVQHQGGLSTVYGHMVRTNVGWGQPVKTGDVIGWVGSTGNSTGPHLHFEVRFAGAPLDPMDYLNGSPPEPFPLPAGWPGSAPDDSRGRR